MLPICGALRTAEEGRPPPSSHFPLVTFDPSNIHPTSVGRLPTRSISRTRTSCSLSNPLLPPPASKKSPSPNNVYSVPLPISGSPDCRRRPTQIQQPQVSRFPPDRRALAQSVLFNKPGPRLTGGAGPAEGRGRERGRGHGSRLRATMLTTGMVDGESRGWMCPCLRVLLD